MADVPSDVSAKMQFVNERPATDGRRPGQTGISFIFAAGVVLLILLFGIILPLLANFSAVFQADFEAQYPAIPSFVILTSPWGSWIIGALGIALLVICNRLLSSQAARSAHAATILGFGILGGILCLILLLPAMTMITMLPS